MSVEWYTSLVDSHLLQGQYMTANQLIQLMNRSPFTSLEVRLCDGAAIFVEQPHEISVTPNSPVCTIYESGNRMRVVSLRNVSQIITADIAPR